MAIELSSSKRWEDMCGLVAMTLNRCLFHFVLNRIEGLYPTKITFKVKHNFIGFKSPHWSPNRIIAFSLDGAVVPLMAYVQNLVCLLRILPTLCIWYAMRRSCLQMCNKILPSTLCIRNYLVHNLERVLGYIMSIYCLGYIFLEVIRYVDH